MKRSSKRKTTCIVNVLTHRHYKRQEDNVRKGCLTFRSRETENYCRIRPRADKGISGHNPKRHEKDTVLANQNVVAMLVECFRLLSSYFLTFIRKEIKFYR